jgi:hypothetical protein
VLPSYNLFMELTMIPRFDPESREAYLSFLIQDCERLISSPSLSRSQELDLMQQAQKAVRVARGANLVPQTENPRLQLLLSNVAP